MKKILLALILTVALLLPCLVACSTPEDMAAKSAAVFTLDVNPGIRVYVKEDNTVLGVEAVNEDGEEILAEIDVEGEAYDVAVEVIVDEMNEQGYLENESHSVLISIEKKEIEISERVNEKINKAFEKHGKIASIIEQELDELEGEIEEAIDEIAERHHISKGKAHVIEKIREERPELSERELAELNMSDLGMMLEGASDDVKGHFKKIGEAVEELYVGKVAALQTALDSLEISAEDVTLLRVFADREDGKMVYEVEFVYDGMEYEITVDAASGALLESESEPFEVPDIGGLLGDFCDKHNIDLGALEGFFGRPEGGADKPHMSKGEILAEILDELDIDEEKLEKTEVKIHEGEGGIVFEVTVKTEDGNTYKVVAEAYSGTVIRVELNGVAINETPEE